MEKYRLLGQIVNPNLLGYVVYDEITQKVQMCQIDTIKRVIKNKKIVNAELVDGELKGTECELKRLCEYDIMGNPLEKCITILSKNIQDETCFYHVVDEHFNTRDIDEGLMYNLKYNGYKISNAKVMLKNNDIVVSPIRGKFLENNNPMDIVSEKAIEEPKIKPVKVPEESLKGSEYMDEEILSTYLLSTVNKKNKVFIPAEYGENSYPYIEIAIPNFKKNSLKSARVCQKLSKITPKYLEERVRTELESEDCDNPYYLDSIYQSIKALDLETYQNDWKLTDENYIGIIKIDSVERYSKVFNDILKNTDKCYRLYNINYIKSENGTKSYTNPHEDIIYFEKGRIKGIVYLVYASKIVLDFRNIPLLLAGSLLDSGSLDEEVLKFKILEFQGVNIEENKIKKLLETVSDDSNIKNVRINGKLYKV